MLKVKNKIQQMLSMSNTKRSEVWIKFLDIDRSGRFIFPSLCQLKHKSYAVAASFKQSREQEHV